MGNRDVLDVELVSATGESLEKKGAGIAEGLERGLLDLFPGTVSDPDSWDRRRLLLQHGPLPLGTVPDFDGLPLLPRIQ